MYKSLKEYQRPSFNQTIDILRTSYFCINGSKPGAGKTHLTSAIAAALRLPVVVIGPLSSLVNWEKTLVGYGVQWYEISPGEPYIFTYDSLRSTRNHQPRHRLLHRIDNDEGTTFVATETLLAIIDAGVLIIFDECQNMRNKSGQSMACKVLFQTLRNRILNNPQCRSRCMLLSGTILDKVECTLNFLQIFGIIEHRNLYTKIKGQVQLHGIDELHSVGDMLNREASQAFQIEHTFIATTVGAREYVNEYFNSVLKTCLMSTMPEDPDLERIEIDTKEAFYDMLPDEADEYRAAITRVSRATNLQMINDDEGVLNMGTNGLGALQEFNQATQFAKVKLATRLVNEVFTHDYYDEKGEQNWPKVVIYADYHIVTNALYDNLRMHNPLLITGDTPNTKRKNLREDYRQEFQEANTKRRLMICNSAVGGVAWDLDDKDGRYPRIVIVFESVKTIQTTQITGRFRRGGTMSPTVIRILYGNVEGVQETTILRAVAKKGKVLADFHQDQNSIFPGQYEKEYSHQRNTPLTPKNYTTIPNGLVFDDLAFRLDNLHFGLPSVMGSSSNSPYGLTAPSIHDYVSTPSPQ